MLVRYGPRTLKRRTFIIIAILGPGVLVGYRLLNPPPPDLSADGYVSAQFDFRELSDFPHFKPRQPIRWSCRH